MSATPYPPATAAASSSSSSSEMLVVKGSRECAHPGCHEHDFLPISCPGCHLPFCISHHSPYLLSSSSTYHPCPSPPPDRTPLPCPLCASPISSAPGEDPNFKMDAHLGSAACSEAAARRGLSVEEREREERRGKKRRGVMCWERRCRKGTKGGLGVRCEACTHTFCLPHRTPTSHSCTPPPSLASSSSGKARKSPLSLSSASTAAGLAALRRQQQKQPAPAARPAAPATAAKAAKQAEPKPLSPAKKSGVKPAVNPFGGRAVASRRSKQEQASRAQALAQRARLGLLNEAEQLEWAEAQAQVGKRAAAGGGGGKGKEKKDCVIC